MNIDSLKWKSPALLVAALLGCNAGLTAFAAEETDEIETPDGAIIVNTMTSTATVTGIDATKRKVTLEMRKGHKTTYKCGPEVVNFDQIQIGDKVKVTYTEAAAVYIGSGAPPSGAAGAGVALAPVGAKPGGVMVDTVRATAEVVAVDAKKHRVTLKLGDGDTKKVKVGKKVNLAAVNVGDNVTVVLSEGLAIHVEEE